MKIFLNTLCLAGLLVCAAAWSAVPIANAGGRRRNPIPVAADGEQVIQGMVTAKTDENLVIDGRTIDTPPTTPCFKDGSRVMLSDIQVGDWLKVTVFRDTAHDRLQATAIEVLPKQN